MKNNRQIAKEITKIQLKFEKPTKQYEEEILKIAPDYPQKYFKSWHKNCTNYRNGIQDNSAGPGTEYFLGFLDAIAELNYNIDLVLHSTEKWKLNKKRSKAINEWLKTHYRKNKIVYPDEIEDNTFFEGAKKQITINAYERNTQAREECILEYGNKCVICNFDFEKVYGEIGKNFIHVHHIKPLSEIKKEYKINPIQDLRPVCPNCHAMLHKKVPAYSIEEIINLVNKKG